MSGQRNWHMHNTDCKKRQYLVICYYMDKTEDNHVQSVNGRGEDALLSLISGI